MNEYEPEFEAPVHTTLKFERIGTEAVRTVIFEGDIQTFAVDWGAYQAGARLKDDE